MSVVLGGVTLAGLVWWDEFKPHVDTRIQPSLGGGINIWEQVLQSRPIDLVGGGDYGWQSKSTLQSLYTLATSLNTTYELNYEGTKYQVRFRHEDGAISAEPVVPRPNTGNTDDYRNVVVRLMIISTTGTTTTTTTSTSTTSTTTSSTTSTSTSTSTSTTTTTAP